MERALKSYRLNLGRRLTNAIFGGFIRLGLGPGGSYLLITRGRRTGQPRTTPVSLVEFEGARWLVSPYGVRPWVLNARAAGRVELRRGRRRTAWTVDEADAATAAPVLRQYLSENKIVAPYFEADATSEVDAFATEAAAHPVFRLTPAED